MKKYTFRLEQVRRVRRAQEEVARGALLSANNSVMAAVSTVEQRSQRYTTAIGTPSSGTTGVAAFIKRRYFDDLVGRAVTLARQEQAAAEAQASARREEWMETAKRVKILDRLDERRAAQHRAEVERETMKEMDEIASGRAMRATSEAGR